MSNRVTLWSSFCTSQSVGKEFQEKKYTIGGFALGTVIGACRGTSRTAMQPVFFLRG
jgi:hypothetical protein